MDESPTTPARGGWRASRSANEDVKLGFISKRDDAGGEPENSSGRQGKQTRFQSMQRKRREREIRSPQVGRQSGERALTRGCTRQGYRDASTGIPPCLIAQVAAWQAGDGADENLRIVRNPSVRPGRFTPPGSP